MFTTDPIPPRGLPLREKRYAEIAETLELHEGVKTENVKTTVGVKRALERLDRRGSQRKIDGVLWVWRTV